MQPGGMFRHGLGRLHRRDPATDLPSSLPATISLPSSIGSADVTADPSATAPIATAQAPSGFTTITETDTLVESITSLNTLSTVTTTRVRTITDSSDYASITSAAAASSPTTATHTTSTTSAAATSSAAAQKSSSNLNTLIPAIVVPIVVVLVASLAAFWFVMRRRLQKEVKTQPEFVMAGRGEKLSSRSNSSRSTTSDKWGAEKKSPMLKETALSSNTTSPPTATSEWPPVQIGVAQPLTPEATKVAPVSRPFDQPRAATANPDSRPYRNFSGPGPRPGGRPGPGPGPGPRPATAGRPGPPSNREPAPYRVRSNTNPNQRDQRDLPPPPRSGPSPVSRNGPSPVLRNGPSPVPPRSGPVGAQGLPSNPRSDPNAPPSSFRFRDPSPTMNHNTRAQAPAQIRAPPPGAYNGASSISQYSPIVKDTPNTARGPGPRRGPPPPLDTSHLPDNRRNLSPLSASPQGNGGGLTEENLRIARLANSSRLGYTPAEPSPSPKLPPPATRSQLIPRESPKDPPETYFAGSSVGPSRETSTAHPNRASVVSDPDDYEDIDARSDVSELNEFERFDFGPAANSRGGSAAGNSLNYFASHNTPTSERGSPFGHDGTYERW